MDYKNNSFSPQPSSDLNLETVRALHQTVVALRAALEQSRSELFELRLKVHSSINTKVYADTIEKLALENHILRERVLSSNMEKGMDDTTKANDPHVVEPPIEQLSDSPDAENKENNASCPTETLKESEELALLPTPTEVVQNDNAEQEEMVNDDLNTGPGPLVIEEPALEEKDAEGGSKPTNDIKIEEDEIAFQNDENVSEQLNQPKINQDSDNESEELDDIELIFTTEETKELGVMQEDLVSICDTENWIGANGKNSLPLTVEKSTQFDEENTGLRMPWTHSVVVETDISKCGIIDENEVPPTNNIRRNTLPSPMPYRPIIHKDVLLASKSPSHTVKFSASRSPRSNMSSDSKRLPMRPILIEPNGSPKCESEAQTDITALPSHWKSESYLAHKVY